MVSVKAFRTLALSFPGVEELPHFEKVSFRIKKKIFAALSEKDKTVCLMFSPADQSVFCLCDPAVMYPVPNKWGMSGATCVNLDRINKSMLKDAIQTSYTYISQKKQR